MLRKVFLVEDETVIREGLRDRIPWDQFGYRFVGEAADGEMALPLIRKTKPDVLITDIKMPFMDGLSLSKIVSKEFPRMKIIIISGYDDFEYARQAMIYGAADFIVKPLKEKELGDALVRAKKQFEGDSQKSDMLEKIKQHIVADGGEIEDEIFLGRVLEYIMKYVTENKTMEDVAEYMELSKDYFGKMCKNKFNITFKQIQTITKMEYAGYLLCNSNIKVYELSERLGYSTPDYFSRIFTETMGVTPKKYGV